MSRTPVTSRRAVFLMVLVASVTLATVLVAQQRQEGEEARPPGLPRDPVPDEVVINTHEIAEVRVVTLARGLTHPWGMAFLPGGDMLITERAGRLRMLRDGVLDPEPVAGVPTVLSRGLAGLMDVTLHPDFDQNRLVYLSYTRPVTEREGTVALVRGRLEGMSLRDVEDVFVAEAWGGATAAARIAFAPDGLLYMTVGGAFGTNPDESRAQDPSSHAGKILRLRDDGSVPPDNPFVGHDGYQPEIFSLGHRNQQGLAFHPATATPLATEHAVQGGDELNVIQPGGNYGWPVVSYGRQYTGERVTGRFWADGMVEPLVFWVPSIAPSGLAFYTGDRFPEWQGNLFVGSMMTGRIGRTGHIERIVFNDNGEELAREWLLTELRQRIRDVGQGPDGLLYVLTEEDDATLLRLEPMR